MTRLRVGNHEFDEFTNLTNLDVDYNIQISKIVNSSNSWFPYLKALTRYINLKNGQKHRIFVKNKKK